MAKTDKISVNGKSYNWPTKPAVVICLDGSEPGPKGYIDTAIRMGSMPFMKSMISKSTYEVGKCAMPSFTNVNNMSIVTGTTPDVHGICGNFFFNPDDGKETLMNDDSLSHQMGIAARSRYERCLTGDIMAHRYFQLYRNVIDNYPSS